MNYRGLVAKYKDRLPVSPRTPIVTLLEGNTPLIPAPRLAKKAGLPEGSVYLKFEGANPTGSFKDRGMTLAVSKAVEEGAKTVVCASTGNTAASAAAYAVRGGLRCLVLLPAGAVAAGKLAQAIAHGAEVLAVKGNFDAALKLVREGAPRLGLTIVNSINPYRIEGQKTASFEVGEQLGRLPTHQFMPVGNAGNITAYWRGYKELQEWYAAHHSHRRLTLPRMFGWQAAGAAPFVLGRPVKEPKTIATAIRIGDPAAWDTAIAARDESRGAIQSVTDREILAAYAFLAREEGVFCEPSSAAGVAGLLKAAKRGLFKGETDPVVVCVLTGHGLKDPDQPKKMKFKQKTIEPTLKALEKAL